MGNRSDNFNRTGTLTGATPSDGGSAWTANNWETNGSLAVPTAAPFTRDTCFLEASSSVGEASITVTTKGNSVGVALRVASINSLVILYQTGNTLALYKKTAAATYAQIGTTYSGTVNNGDVIKIGVTSGNAISGYQNGTLRVGPNTDSYNSTATGVGFECLSNTATVQIDDFVFTDTAGAAAGSALPVRAFPRAILNF